jgi:hypothetical protein
VLERVTVLYADGPPEFDFCDEDDIRDFIRENAL